MTMVRFRSREDIMLRQTASLLLVGGVALLVTWGVRSAESQGPRTVARAAAEPLPALPAELEEINLQVDRLIARLERQPATAVPTRDPFRFATPARSTRSEVEPPAPVTALVEVVQPEWPSLVAIMTNADDGLRVALSDRAGELHVLALGATLGPIAVTAIDGDAVILVDQPSGQKTRLTIR